METQAQAGREQTYVRYLPFLHHKINTPPAHGDCHIGYRREDMWADIRMSTLRDSRYNAQHLIISMPTRKTRKGPRTMTCRSMMTNLAIRAAANMSTLDNWCPLPVTGESPGGP